MSKIKALEKLYEWCTCAGTSPCRECANQVRHIADEIKVEVDENFMTLPLDADGVPIRVGDEVANKNTRYDDIYTVVGLTSDRILVYGGNASIKSSQVRHVKPRTLEDVLEEFVRKSVEPISNNREADLSDIAFCIDKDKMDKYAAEIRELLGCDAE